MSVYSGDFLGFRLGNIHSSQLNITRVSDGNWYNDTFVPTFTDATAPAPGRDGTYYWSTYYTQKPITINFAFDNLGENDLRRLRQVFGFKGVQELVFDEAIYKKYMVKCSNPPTLKYIAFSEGDFTIYKGEGIANLVALYPYGISTYETVIGKSLLVSGSSQTIISNVGDIEMPMKLIFPIESTDLTLQLEDTRVMPAEVLGTLSINGLTKVDRSVDKFYCVDMRTHLIEGLDNNFNKTGNLYNRYITSGDFFNVPVGIYKLTSAPAPWEQISYNFLYY